MQPLTSALVFPENLRETNRSFTAFGVLIVLLVLFRVEFYSKDINVSKISTSSPSITEVSLGKEDEKPYLYVVAKDPDNQPLMYKLNDGKWQESDKLFDLKEGDNFVVVKNEAGVVTSLKKYVYLSLYTGKEEGLSEKSLYNYIKVSPASWTNGSVSVSLVLPDSIIEKLSVSPYSINGAAFSANRTKTVSANEETVQFTVKDIYGNTHTSQVYTVTNIDKEKPSLEVVSKSGSFTIKAADSGSGIAKITVSSSSASNYVIKANSSDKVSSDNATYKAPSNGTYQFTVYDYAGNTTTVSGTMSYYTKENGKVQTAAKSSGTTTKTSSTTSKSSAATTKSSSKTSTASVDKKYAEEEKTSSATLGAKKDTEKKDNKKTASKDVSSEPVVVKEERRIISNAGNSVSPDLPEAEKIEVIREQDPALSSPPQMQTTEKLDNTNEKRLKGLVILIIAASAAAVLVAIWVNSVKGREKDDFSFRK